MRSLFLAVVLVAAATTVPAAPFADGDRIACVGDSITHGGFYYAYLQLMQCLRHPGSRVQFINCGISGEKSGSGLWRCDWDVLAQKPNRAAIMFGMNDLTQASWREAGLPSAETQAARSNELARYEKNMTALVDKLQAAKCEVILVTPSPYDQYGDCRAANCAARNDPGLASCSDILRRLAQTKKTSLVDAHAALTPIWKAHPEAHLSGQDRVHPWKVGHLLIASCFWKAWGETNCLAQITVKATGNRVSYRYAPTALPFPVVGEWREANKFLPLSDFNRELFAVAGLDAGSYSLAADGTPLGTFTAEQLAAGVNLAELNTPGQRQAKLVYAKMLEMRETAAKLRTLVAMEIIARGMGAKGSDYASSTNALTRWLAILTKAKNPHLKYYTNQVNDYVRNKAEEEQIRRELEVAHAEMERLSVPAAYRLTVEKSGR